MNNDVSNVILEYGEFHNSSDDIQPHSIIVK